MEKQKIFWVVLSVSIFVVVVLVAGVYLLRQKPLPVTSTPGTVNPITDQGTQVYEYSQEKPQAQTPGEKPGEKPGEPQTMHFYIGEGDKGQQTAQKQQPGEKPVPTPPTQVQPPQAPAQQQVLAPPTLPPAATPRTTPETPAQTAAQVKKPSHPVKQAAVAKPRPARHVDYWIQTGSYRSQSKADELVALLADKGLSGKVFSFDSNKATFYRVRIGPYSNAAEADKFLGIVKQIQGLESSFVSQVLGTPGVN
ncbi:MAG TPA: SPOR domain-containing protein [Spirochaetia bacterium]|nr:SPOR domain-containing protein [Spirochaetia bacterium]